MCADRARNVVELPDHGAAVVRIVLDTPELRADWDVEVGVMRDRIADPWGGSPRRIRGWPISAISSACLDAADQPQEVISCAREHAIYMADRGRFNVIGGPMQRSTGSLRRSSRR